MRFPFSRSPRETRFGSFVEQLFGAANAQLLAALPGNTQLIKNQRQVTKSVNPARLTTWALPDLHRAVEAYFFDYFNHVFQPQLGACPADLLESLVVQHGVHALRVQQLDKAFLAANGAQPVPTAGVEPLPPQSPPA